MKYKEMGKSGIMASVVGIGTWQMGGFRWGSTDETESVRALQAAVDAGISLIDTAPSYGLGLSEEVVGKAVKGKRDQVILATKCGLVWHTDKGKFHFNEYGKSVHRYLGAESIKYEVEQSLRRLGTDYIDIYQTHRQDSTTPVEETMEALLRLQQEGKIRAIGVSNTTVRHIEEYLEYGVIASAQELYSMLDREIENELLPYCRQHSISMLAYAPLAKGLLTGKIGPERRFTGDDQRIDNPRFSVENRIKTAEMLEKFKPVAEAHKVTLAQLVIAWTFSQSGVTHVLCGTQRVQQAVENAGAGDITLSAREIEYMNGIIEQ